jgi:hypothetical protein
VSEPRSFSDKGDEFDRPSGELPPVQSLTGLDGMFAKTNIVVLIIFSFCCNGIALILGIIGLVVCKDPRAKQNALITTIIGGIMTLVGIGAQVAMKH